MNHKMMGWFLAAFLTLSPFVYAQDQQQSVDDVVSRMTTELNLTESQADAVKPIVKEYMTKRDEVLQEAQGEALVDRTALKNTIGTLKQNEYQKLGKILSEDQMKRWIQKENLRAALNQDGTESQVGDDTTLTPSGANFKF